jgi:gliding motility-associated-like protein
VDGVSNDTIGTPILSPEVTTTYLLELNDSSFCTAYDSIRVIVVDPTTIDCTDILLPSAFTPNGDGLNDEFGISNPFSTGELLAFEIFDRWGNIVYSSLNVLERWDGTYKGTLVDPGVFLYKVHFRCEGQEDVKSGSVTVIR